jgi:hypothetical protein
VIISTREANINVLELLNAYTFYRNVLKLPTLSASKSLKVELTKTLNVRFNDGMRNNPSQTINKATVFLTMR